MLIKKFVQVKESPPRRIIKGRANIPCKWNPDLLTQDRVERCKIF
jgi:hypothetical protein